MADIFDINKKYVFKFELFKRHTKQEDEWAKLIDNKEIEITREYIGYVDNMGVICEWCEEI
ncbi:hypothetical protein [Romboutsia ilealis]|uniref:hypothetical protein n=1 Tax=Romboutsia ilealis TaxID=1115758 RepID=UPI0025728A41|nr:hypothetical protein [Romboutsia ilealis]